MTMKIGPEQPSQSFYQNILDRLDRALGGEPTALVHTPSDPGTVNLEDIRTGLDTVAPPGAGAGRDGMFTPDLTPPGGPK